MNHKILANTAALYSHRANDDSRYVVPSKILNGVIEKQRIAGKTSSVEIANSDQFIVIRVQTASGKPELIRHPLDLVDKGVMAGIETLKARGMLNREHTCLIAIPRGSLTGVFTFVYEVVRQSGWSVLPLGGSVDSQDISQLCSAYGVDTLIIAADALDSVFAPEFVGQFDSVRNLLYISGIPTQGVLETIRLQFPQLEVAPFIYLSNATGPIGLPISGVEDNEFSVFENVLVEVESIDGEITLNGSGRLLVSILGLEQPSLIRRDVGDFGTLTTNIEGRQTIKLRGSNVL